ncbi:MAG: hypothetical protein Q8P67_25520, partial [archaeon]|nr:hypothetical protein [archaeon]
MDRLVDDEDQETGFPSIFTGRSELPELGFLGSNDASLLRAGLRELGKHLSGVPQVEGAGGRFYEKVAVALGQLVQRLSSGEVGKAAKGRKGRGAISGANSSSGLADVVACELLASVCLSDVLRILPEPPRQFPSREVFLTMLRQFRHLSGPHEGEGFLWVSELIGVMELCDAFVLLVDLDEGALLPELFRAVLESVRGDTPEALRRKLLKILAVCLEEMVGNIDLPLLELILQPLLAPSSSSSSSSSSFTK